MAPGGSWVMQMSPRVLDDLFILGSDGSFSNDMGGETWLEGWQGVDGVRYTDRPMTVLCPPLGPTMKRQGK